jgi:tRNA (Thr-GGU) A37 N-methylase
MGEVVVRYRVKPERAEENQLLIERVFAELAERRPAGLAYASFRLEDGVSFVHVASVDAGDGGNPLREISAFADFTLDLAERCDEPPVAQDARLVGSYGLFAGGS